jgi:manganese/zinc/iron transport system substrate-binding protein
VNVRRRILGLAALAVVAISVLGAAGCGGDAGADDGKVSVVTTTNWHADLVEAIGGDRVAVEALMGPGVDPHLYTATAGDVDALSEADLAVWNGLELEGKMNEVFAEFEESGTPVLAVGEAVPENLRIPITGIPGKEYDPHIWFDPVAWGVAARALADELAELDPEGTKEYEVNLGDFEKEMERSYAEMEELLAAVPESSRVLVTSHDAFSYFGKAHGFEVAPIQGKSTATEATTADIERVAETVADAQLDAVFIESSVPQQTIDAVLAAAEQRGYPTEVGGQLYGDALGDPGSPEGTYTGAVLANARTIADGLAGGGSGNGP